MLRLNQWASRNIGMKDYWTALQFDSAVMTWGRYVENALRDGDVLLEEILGIENDETRERQNRNAANFLKGMAASMTGIGVRHLN